MWTFRVPWSPSYMLGLPQRGDSSKWSKWPWSMIHSMPCRNPCRFYIHLAFSYILHWSLKRGVKRTWTSSAFLHQWECLTCNGHGHSYFPSHKYPICCSVSLMCEVALTISMNQGPLHTWDWEPMTMTLQAISLVGRSKFASRHTWGTNGVCECKMDAKSTWLPTWHQVDNVSWSLGLFSRTMSWRQA